MGNRMIDGYVRRDPNADSDHLASRDDGVILPEVAPIPESGSNEVVVIRPTEVDWASENREYSATTTASSPLMTLNDMVKQYWGLLIVGGILLTAGVFIGRRV